MLVKWITCQVTEGNRALFSKAQEQWKSLSSCEGFHGQMGGWNACNPTEACLVALWEDKQTYQTFMNGYHDTIVEKNDQAKTYEKIEVKLVEVEERIKLLDIVGIVEGRQLFVGNTPLNLAFLATIKIRMESNWTVEGRA